MELEHKNYWLLFYGLIIGVSFDILFYDKTPGISYLIFTFLILLILIISFRSSLKKLKNIMWLFSIPVLSLASTFFIYSNQVLKILNFLIIPILIIILSILVTDINKSNWPDIRFIGDIIKRIFVPLGFIHKPFQALSRMEAPGSKENRSKILPKILLGILISVPILAIIIWLLSSADIIFKDLFLNIPVSKIIKHFFVIIIVSIYATCFVWALIKAFNEMKQEKYSKIKWKLFFDPVILLTILVLVNVIYAIFSIIQFTYLFGGNSFVLPSSYTYAEYARKGFFELIVVSIINFGILIFSKTFVKKDNKKAFTIIRVFLTLLVIFTLILIVSAFYRMLVYEQAYGFTYLRIFVQAFMIMLFFLSISNIIYTWKPNFPVIKYYFIISLTIYVIMNFANVDAIIAENNIDRYFKSGQIDTGYLKDLSYDAIPQMERFLTSNNYPSESEEKQITGEILEYYKQKKSELESRKSWQSFNISRYRAEKVIDKYIK
ncbi:MAG: DUF4173 domain-containing protein [Actinomycetota bacterium]|nr:DUF4173 domain-containing protein [Actinomycetota bacterium]